MPNLLDSQAISFHDRPILFIDLETTGLEVSRHEIIEVAALVVRQPDFKIVNSYYTKVIPNHLDTADPQALQVVGFNQKLWSDAIPLRQMLTDLSALAPKAILAGWSVQTEWDFLISALQAESLPYFFTHRLLEVYTLAFMHFYQRSDIAHLNLPTVCKQLNIHLDQHKPDSDIRATYEIFTRLLTKNPAV